jgi:hypothetical protein
MTISYVEKGYLSLIVIGIVFGIALGIVNVVEFVKDHKRRPKQEIDPEHEYFVKWEQALTKL